MEQIREIHQESKEIYGAPKITIILQEQGERISEKTVENHLRVMGINAWVLSDTLEAKHVVETIEKAKRKRAVDKSKIMHVLSPFMHYSKEGG